MNKVIIFVIILFTHNILANEDYLTTTITTPMEEAAQWIPKDVDWIINCGECCNSDDDICNIYYGLCSLKEFNKIPLVGTFRKGFLAYSTANIDVSGVFAKLKNKFNKKNGYQNGVFIINYKKELPKEKKTIQIRLAYFEKNSYKQIFREMENNIDELLRIELEEEKQRLSCFNYIIAKQFNTSIKNTKNIKKKIKDKTSITCEPDKIENNPDKTNCLEEIEELQSIDEAHIFKRTINGEQLELIPVCLDIIQETFDIYNTVLSNDHLKIEYPNLLANCTSKKLLLQKSTIQSTAINKIITTLPSVKTTDSELYNRSNISHYNRHQKPSATNNTVLYSVIAGVVSGVVIIIVIVTFVGYKFYRKNTNKKNKAKEKTVEYTNKMLHSNEHIYEEPYFLDENKKRRDINDTVPDTPTKNNTENNNEQNSATSDIIKSSKKTDNTQLTVIVVNPSDAESDYYSNKTNKAILINLPNDQNSPKAKIIEIPQQDTTAESLALEDDNQKRIYHVLESEPNESLEDTAATIPESDDNLGDSSNDTQIYDYNTLQHNNSVKPITSATIKPKRTNIGKSPHKYVNVDISNTEVSNTSIKHIGF